MSSLQKVNLGTPPKAEDGDPVRTANVKANENVDVLNAQSALTSAAQLVDSPQTLTADLHLGRRVNISLAAAGEVQMPDAASCGADGVVLLRNIGTTIATLASKTGSGDSVALSKLNPGEAVLMDTDGVHAWTVLMRGRTNSDDEVVNGNFTVSGNSTVNGNETVGGTLGVTGAATLASATVAGALVAKGVTSFGSAAQATISAAGAYSGTSAAYSGNVTVGGTFGVTGVATFSTRPTFNGATPWDSGNLASPATLNTAQSFSAAKVFAQLTVAAAFNATAVNNQAFLNGSGAYTFLSFGVNAGGGAGSLAYAASTGGFAFYNYNATGYVPVICSTLTQTSDMRLKSDIQTIADAMSLLRKVRGVRYTMDGKRGLGVIAQEVAEPFPELIEELDIPEGDEKSPLLGVKYANMVGPLLQGLLEMDEVVQGLLIRIAALEDKQ
ncbi:tail fiber domain-containing protein [Paraburkholderia xenovorans]